MPLNDKYVLYNSFENKFILAEGLLYQLMVAAETESDLEYLCKLHPSFFEALKTKGFIISEERDEFEEVKELTYKVDQEDNKTYRLVINSTMNCNFNCWYCYESHIKDSKMSLKVIEMIKKHIVNLVSKNTELNNLLISWFGGEPLLQYAIVKDIAKFSYDFCKENNIVFSMDFTTNGFLINEDMISDFLKFNVRNLQITLDGNRSTHDAVRFVSKKRGSYDTILKNVLSLCRNNIQVSLRINYTKSNLDNLEDILVDLDQLEEKYRNNIIISFHKVWQEKDDTLGPRLLELCHFFRKSGFKAIYGDLPDNVKNSCYADKRNQATINYNGEVFKCTARDFASSSKEGDLEEDGVINWNNKLEKRMNIKFKNKPCLTCAILPICNGGCSQRALESNGEDYCVYDFDENKKKELVMQKFWQIMN